MLSITKVNNSIKVEGLDNKQFPDNGTLMIPLNSVILTLDESNIATFRSAANNDVLFSGVITDIQIDGTSMTKQTITTSFTAIANSSGGGGGTVDAYTKAETDALLATKANESELSDYATVESLATVATSGDYADLTNKPTIPVVPTDVSAFNNDAGYITQEEVIINEAFPNGWHTTGTMADLIADINADTDAVAGKVYMDTVSFSDLPGEMQQAELKAEIISQLGNSKVIVFTVTSSEVSPYHWEYTSAYGQTNSWREWVTPAVMQSALSVKANSADLAAVATTGSYDDLTNKPTIPAAQIQSDWNQSDNSAADYIKNKPVNVSAFTNDAGYLTQHQSLADYSTTQEMNTAIATATNDMATMTWVGEQGYLTQHQDISDLFNGAEYDTQTKRINFKHGNTVLAYIDATAFIKDGMVSNVEVKNVTISGESVLCLVITFNTDAGKEPINIPISDIFDASNYYTKTEADNTFVKPADLATVATSGDYTDLSNTPNLATVATTGDYDDLTNKPVIPAAQVQSDWNEADNTSKAYIQNKPSLATVATTGDYTDLSNTPSLATVATTGDYDDLSNKPTIPTVPTNVSAFTNDAGYVQSTDLATVATTGDYDDLTNKPTIPAAQVQSDWTEADTTSKAYIQNKPSLATVATTGNYSDLNGTPSLATVATSGDYTDLSNTPNLATVATTGDYDDLTNKPTIPTVPTNVSAFTNDAGYTTNTGTITGITMNGVSKGTSGVVDLGTVITDISGKQDVIDASHKLDADLVDDTTSTNKFVTASDKSTWGGKQDALVSGTNIKTINNESILGSGNITISGGSSYTAGDNIDITNDVISVDIDDEKKVIASALTELHNDKADKNQLNNYQLKGDYQTGAQVDAKITTATSTLRTEAEAINVEKVDAAALTDLNARVTDLEQGGGGSGITGITMNGSAVTVTSGVADLGTVVTDVSGKQDTLVSGTNIKTINNQSILGSGNISISGGGGGDGITGITMNGSSVTVTSGVADLGTVITEHQSLSNYYTKSEIDAMIGQINTLLAAI